MSVARRQRTLVRPVSVTGFGYFSGRDMRVEFWPAAEHAGITFVRHDIGAAARVPASVGASHQRAAPHDARTRTACAWKWSNTCWPPWPAMRIDNCEVWVDAAEMPGCDGSSKAFVEAIDAAGSGRAAQPRVGKSLVGQAIRVGDDELLDRSPALAQRRSVRFLRFGFRRAVGDRPSTFRARYHARFIPPRIGALPHVHS